MATKKTFPGRRVLVIDDDHAQADSLTQLLQVMGCRAQYITDPRDALRLIGHLNPHLVFVDINMPHIDGYEVARFVRTNQDYEGMRLVALTGDATEEERTHSRLSGFDAHLPKPASPELIEAALALLT